MEGSLQRRFNQVVFGHSKQLWGLAVNHLDGSLATAGYDKHIVKWRDTHLEWRIQVQSECVSVAIHIHTLTLSTFTLTPLSVPRYRSECVSVAIHPKAAG
ncbi:hypothetical protein Pmani_038950 [Petrolisthes manimaculis]|uniref:Uncharacterized protein n=1 Tax=Petrolisthes manimaculis TaxID=1843537 RepID=A0AAE1NDV4_9EUCA|nr:hypothetical protein Pmani_038950 [Petrolisthes manimaculis]